MIEQIHLPQCPSTQDILKKLFFARSTPTSTVLVSTSNQTNGVGRRGNHWDFYPYSLAFSFNIKANPSFLITPLEMAVLLAHFFSSKFHIDIQLKWPNDLILDTGKCGGILCQSDNLTDCFIGIGINGSALEKDHYKFQAKALSLPENAQENLPYEIVSFIKKNRMRKEEVCHHWKEACFHMNRPVQIVDQNVITAEGQFCGIGENGEALIQTKAGLKEIISGSLFLVE